MAASLCTGGDETITDVDTVILNKFVGKKINLSLKEFLSRPKFSAWKIGILIAVFLFIVFWIFFEKFTLDHCGGTISGMPCSILYLAVYFFCCLFLGMLGGYLIKKFLK